MTKKKVKAEGTSAAKPKVEVVTGSQGKLIRVGNDLYHTIRHNAPTAVLNDSTSGVLSLLLSDGTFETGHYKRHDGLNIAAESSRSNEGYFFNSKGKIENVIAFDELNEQK